MGECYGFGPTVQAMRSTNVHRVLFSRAVCKKPRVQADSPDLGQMQQPPT
jgi:hypothetical protein